MVLDVIIKNPNPNELIGNQIIRNYVWNRLNDNRNVIIGLFGKGAVGKSVGAITIGDIIEPDFDLETQIIYTPLQFRNAIQLAMSLRDKFFVMIFDEAQFLLDAKTWFDFVTHAISQIMVTFRQLKRLCVIIIAPSIKWIEKNLRELLDLYARITRPLFHSSYINFKKVWVDDRNIEFPKIRTSDLRVRIGKQSMILKDLMFYMPKPERVRKYEELSIKFKGEVIQTKLEGIFATIEKAYGVSKIEQLVGFYLDRPDLLAGIVKKGKITQERIPYPLDRKEFKVFKDLMTKKLIEKGVIPNVERPTTITETTKN